MDAGDRSRRPSRRRRSWCCLAVAIATTSVLLCGGGIEAFVYLRLPPYSWKGWVDSRRLTPPRWAIEMPAPNGRDVYARIEQLLPRVSDPDSTLLAGWPKGGYGADDAEARRTMPEARAALTRQAEVLDVLRQGADLPYARGAEPDPEALFPEFTPYRNAARIAVASAWADHLDGRDDEALRTLEDVAALGAHLQNGESAIQAYVGASCIAYGRKCATPVLREGSPSPEAVRRYAARLRELRQRPKGLGMTLCWEAQQVDLALERFQRGEVESLALLIEAMPGAGWLQSAMRLKAGQSRLWLRDRYARLIEEAEKPPAEEHYEEMREQAERDAEERMDTLARLLLPISTNSPRRIRASVGQLAGQETIAALELFRRANGKYPDTLGALVPAFLPDLPPDPFTGGPMVYRTVEGGYVLYGLGPNKADDGGVSESRGSSEPDQVFVDDRAGTAPAAPAR
jgi:hypothetical protein